MMVMKAGMRPLPDQNQTQAERMYDREIAILKTMIATILVGLFLLASFNVREDRHELRSSQASASPDSTNAR